MADETRAACRGQIPSASSLCTWIKTFNSVSTCAAESLQLSTQTGFATLSIQLREDLPKRLVTISCSCSQLRRCTRLEILCNMWAVGKVIHTYPGGVVVFVLPSHLLFVGGPSGKTQIETLFPAPKLAHHPQVLASTPRAPDFHQCPALMLPVNHHLVS
jgi:hypothetical protein